MLPSMSTFTPFLLLTYTPHRLTCYSDIIIGLQEVSTQYSLYALHPALLINGNYLVYEVKTRSCHCYNSAN